MFQLYFDYEIFEQIKRLYEQVVPDHAQRPWNLSIESLREAILALDEDQPQKQEFLEQLNRSVAQLTLQPIAPSEQTTYLIWFVLFIVLFEFFFLFLSYDIFNQFLDGFVDEMIIIHNTLQIPEPTSESYPDVDLCENLNSGPLIEASSLIFRWIWIRFVEEILRIQQSSRK